MENSIIGGGGRSERVNFHFNFFLNHVKAKIARDADEILRVEAVIACVFWDFQWLKYTFYKKCSKMGDWNFP